MNKRELLFPYNALYYLLVINNCKFKKFYHQISFFFFLNLINLNHQYDIKKIFIQYNVSLSCESPEYRLIHVYVTGDYPVNYKHLQTSSFALRTYC